MNQRATFLDLDLASARALAAERGIRLAEAMQERSGLAGPEFTSALSAALGLPVLHLAEMEAHRAALDRLGFAEALGSECVLLARDGRAPLLVLSDPFDADVRARAQDRIGGPYDLALAHRLDITAYLARLEQGMRAMDDVVGSAATGPAAGERGEDLSLQRIQGDTSPTIKLVNSTLYDALKLGASDIHLESTAAGLTVRYRLDGVLSTAVVMDGTEQAEQVISRIKVMAELDIAERRVPQDGRFKVAVTGRAIDVRVSVIPSIFGEDAVLRILDKQALSDSVTGLTLERLGYAGAMLAGVRRLAREPYGMLLVTGPTGSGKTTTLYAAISEINDGRDKVVTIEDPVEYQLPGVLQIPVNEKKGLGFARGLRSVLRHDPDKIMVGEIRDPETAQIAVQAALTGHLVFTTVHANGVLDVVGRFLHMGVDAHNFLSALNGVVAQRLLRSLCRACAAPVEPDPAVLFQAGIVPATLQGAVLRKGAGCADCRGTGYRGRTAVAELLRLNDELRELIAGNAPLRQVKDAARRAGLVPLREAALELARAGTTSIEEVARVTLAA